MRSALERVTVVVLCGCALKTERLLYNEADSVQLIERQTQSAGTKMLTVSVKVMCSDNIIDNLDNG